MVLTLADLTDVDTKRAGPTAVDVGELCYSCAGGGLEVAPAHATGGRCGGFRAN